MSQSFSCHCEERRKPVAERSWGVVARRCNFSAFSGYQRTSSDYSTVVCLMCFAGGRTKAAYVDLLQDVKLVEGEWKITGQRIIDRDTGET